MKRVLYRFDDERHNFHTNSKALYKKGMHQTRARAHTFYTDSRYAVHQLSAQKQHWISDVATVEMVLIASQQVYHEARQRQMRLQDHRACDYSADSR